MIPWIYLCFNRDFDTGTSPSLIFDDKVVGNSLNSSRTPQAGLSTNINKSGVLINNNNTLN
jgi:hypothetical protein